MTKTLKDVTTFFAPRPMIRLSDIAVGHVAQFSRKI